MNSLKHLYQEFENMSDPKRAEGSMRFFKTEKGSYGAGDIFIGVTVPLQRKLSKEYKDLSQKDLKELISSPIHEHRLIALFILDHQYKAYPKRTKNFYVKHIKHVNNWDLVDASAHKILGKYLFEEEEDRDILYTYARSKDLWKKRISIVATAWFIKNNDLDDTFALSEILLYDDHDLIHKAVGWMLREAGKRDAARLETFLKKHYKTMPRTCLRYAIEKFPEKRRKAYLSGTIDL